MPPLAEPDAVSLFVERSGLEASKAIAELCSRLDSLPLAVELAAARTKALTPGQILERLSSRLDLLKGGRDADPRQQTLRATIEWSYDLLSDEEQRLFRALSVFAGGCTLEAAEAVADAEIDTLQSLAEKSLLRFTRERYWMLETIREYADARLTGAGERDQTLKAHARDMATSAQRSIQLRQENYAGWSRLLEDEEANLRAALAFMVDTGDLAALDTFHALGYFWGIRGNWREGHVWGVRVLALGQGDHTAARCHALSTAASFAGNLGDLDEATRYYRESLSIARELGDASTAAARLGDLGLLAANLGDLADAERLLKAAVEEAEAANATEGLVFSLGNLADLALRRGHFDAAASVSRRTLALSRELEREDLIGWALSNLAQALHGLGRRDEAAEAAVDALRAQTAAGDSQSQVWTLVLLASIHVQGDNATSAAVLAGAVEAASDRFGAPVTGAEARLLEATVERARRALKDDYAGYATTGLRMTLDEAVEYALASLD